MFALAGVTASAQQAAATDSGTTLVGEWRGAMSKSSSDTKLAISMFKDGSYVRRIAIVSEYAWTSEPHMLNIAPVTRKGDDIRYGRPVGMRMSVNGTSLTTRFGKDSLVLFRLGASSDDSSIVGRWQGENASGAEVVQEFAPDGQLLVMVTVARDAGRYTVVDDRIDWQLQIPNNEMRKEKFRIEGGKLKLFVTPGRAPVELVRGPVQPPP